MVRPRWHDFVIVAGVLGLLAVGMMALWGDDIRGWFSKDPSGPSETGPAPAPESLAPRGSGA